VRSEVREVPRPDGDPRDPYGILPGGPDAFCEEWGADTVAEALAAAEDAPSTTPAADMRRCKFCGSRKLRKKKANYNIEHMKAEGFRCEECHEHQDNPAPPLSEVDGDIEWHPNNAKHTAFEWVVDSDQLEDKPDPGLHPDLPDLEERDVDEAARWAVLLTRPWSDDDGMTIREAAEHIPFSRQFVTRRKQMWRDGELPRITAEAYLREADDETATNTDTDQTARRGRDGEVLVTT